MDFLPQTFPALKEHLNKLISSPSGIELNVKLIEAFTAQLTEAEFRPLIPELVPLISAVLPSLNTDPTPLTTLLQHLLSTVSFTEILPLTTLESILQALSSPSPPIQILGLSLLQKASFSASEAGIVASWVDVVKTVVEVILLASDTGVSMKATLVLSDLLQTDLVSKGGSGLVWRRVLGDSGVYQLFYRICSWEGDDVGGKRTKTEAQGRLLGLVEKMAELNWAAVVQSRFPEVEEKYFTENKEVLKAEKNQGLLGFVAKGMVRAAEDLMMHLLLLEFYSALLRIKEERGWEYLKNSGLHASTVVLYLAPESYTDDSLDQDFLESKAAEYIYNFSILYPQHLVSALAPNIPPKRGSKRRRISAEEKAGEEPPKPLVQALLDRISFHLSNTPQNPHSPSLRVLSVFPAQILAEQNTEKVLDKIPLSPPNPEYFLALATIFRTSKVAYARYKATHPQFWTKIIEYASTVALKDTALASLAIVEALVSETSWASIHSASPRVASVKNTGLEELVVQPGVMTFLLTPPTKFLSARAGAGVDPESSVYKVAVRKFEVLMEVDKQLAKRGDEVPGGEGWRVVLEERLKLGVWGGRASVEVATVDL